MLQAAANGVGDGAAAAGGNPAVAEQACGAAGSPAQAGGGAAREPSKYDDDFFGLLYDLQQTEFKAEELEKGGQAAPA